MTVNHFPDRVADMAHSNYTHLSPELQTMIFDQVYGCPVQKPCGNNNYCLVNHSIQPQSNCTTSVMLRVNRHMHGEIMIYQFYKFDIYLIHGRVTVVLGHDTQSLYLQPLPLVPSMRGTFASLLELWIVAGSFSFQELNNITPQLSNLQRINLEHDMTNEKDFIDPRVFLVDYCNNNRAFHYPQLPAQATLTTESKQALESRYQLSAVENKPIAERDLRWFLTRGEARPVFGVQITVHLRCPMRLCDTCAKGGNSSRFRVFEKKMTIRYDFDSVQVLGVGWVEMK